MGIKTQQYNIKGEMVDIKDFKKISELLTAKDKAKIQKLENDIVDVDKKKGAYRELEDLMKDLQSAASQLYGSTGAMSKKVPSIVGMDVSEFISYANVDVKEDAELGQVSFSISQIAEAEKWQSKTFNSKVISVTQQSGGTDPSMFTEGEFKILIPDNAVQFSQVFTTQSVVGNGSGLFKNGEFFINDNSVLIQSSDTLDTIATRINGLKIGITASVEAVSGGNTIVLRSETIGVQHAFTINDPNGLFSNLTQNVGSTGYFYEVKNYKTITLESGDSLSRIAYKINAMERYTNLHADVVQVSTNKYILVLKSLETGANAKFHIDDNSTILNGSNGGSVFGNIFDTNNEQSTNVILQQGLDMIIDVDGIEMSRPTNSIQITDNILVNPKTTTNGKTLIVNVSHDSNAAFLAVNKLVEQYNKLAQFCQTQQEVTPDGKIPKDALLKDDRVVTDFYSKLKNFLTQVERADIGISNDILKVDTPEGGRKVYRDMMKVDNQKLLDKMNLDMNSVIKAFDSFFDSQDDAFQQPLFKKSIYVNNALMGDINLDLDIKVDLSQAKVKSKSSRNFDNVNSVVDISDRKKFSPGTFFINNQPVQISNGMSLSDVAAAINATSSMSRISAAVNGSYISFTQYSGSYGAKDDAEKFTNMNLYDPYDVLQDVFSTSLQTNDFDVADTSSASANINTGQEIIINDVSITFSTNTLSHVISEINSKSKLHGVIAEAVVNPTTGKLFLNFKSQRLKGITIDNTNNAITPTITALQSQQKLDKFFDVSKAVEVGIHANNKHYNKPFSYYVYGDDINGTAKITILNNKNDPFKVDNLEIIYSGVRPQTETQISISQGIAGGIDDLINTTLQPQAGYGAGLINQAITDLDKKKDNITSIKSKSEEQLEEEKKRIVKRYSKMHSELDRLDAYDDLIDMLREGNSKK